MVNFNQSAKKKKNPQLKQCCNTLIQLRSLCLNLYKGDVFNIIPDTASSLWSLRETENDETENSQEGI